MDDHSKDIVRKLFERMFFLEESGRGSIYACCMSCDGRENSFLITNEDDPRVQGKTKHRSALTPIVCGKCERDWVDAGFWDSEPQRGSAGPSEGLAVSNEILDGWKKVVLLREACAAQGEELECIRRVIPRQLLFSAGQAGLTMNTVRIEKSENGKAVIDKKPYLCIQVV